MGAVLFQDTRIFWSPVARDRRTTAVFRGPSHAMIPAVVIFPSAAATFSRTGEEYSSAPPRLRAPARPLRPLGGRLWLRRSPVQRNGTGLPARFLRLFPRVRGLFLRLRLFRSRGLAIAAGALRDAGDVDHVCAPPLHHDPSRPGLLHDGRRLRASGPSSAGARWRFSWRIMTSSREGVFRDAPDHPARLGHTAARSARAIT